MAALQAMLNVPKTCLGAPLATNKSHAPYTRFQHFNRASSPLEHIQVPRKPERTFQGMSCSTSPLVGRKSDRKKLPPEEKCF